MDKIYEWIEQNKNPTLSELVVWLVVHYIPTMNVQLNGDDKMKEVV